MKIIQFLIDNKATIMPVIVLFWSELLSLNPKIKSNGIIQLVSNIIKGK